jgi:uncharacterized membrane protein
MTDHPETPALRSTPWRRNMMRRSGAIGSAVRTLPKNPVFLIGAALVGVAGVLAWRNRDRIAATTTPLIEDAKAKGQELIEDAKTKGHELIDEAKAKTQAIGEKARARRRTKAGVGAAPDLH